MLFTISAIRFVPGNYLPLVDKMKPHRNPDVLTQDKTFSPPVMAQITQPTTFAAYVKEKGLLGSKLLADIAVLEATLEDTEKSLNLQQRLNVAKNTSEIWCGTGSIRNRLDGEVSYAQQEGSRIAKNAKNTQMLGCTARPFKMYTDMGFSMLKDLDHPIIFKILQNHVMPTFGDKVCNFMKDKLYMQIYQPEGPAPTPRKVVTPL